MNKFIRSAGLFLLIIVLVVSLAACGQRNTQPVDTPTVPPSEIVVETPPPSPTPTPTPTPSVPPVTVTTVPMPMPSVSPTVNISTTPDPANPTASPVVSPTVSPSASVSPSPSPTPTYSAEANFASTINPDTVTVPADAIAGYINANGVNFRGGPNNSARIIATLESGTYVDIIGTEGEWTEVIIGGVAGYIRSTYVTRGQYVGAGSIVVGDTGPNGGVIIVPNAQTPATSNPNETNFLGIMPD